MMKVSSAAALVMSLFYAAPGAQDAQTYEQSIAAKRNVPCVTEARNNPEKWKSFNNAFPAVYGSIMGLQYSGLPYTEMLSRLKKLKEEYGECVAMYAMNNSVPDSFYERMGRKKPPLTGTYEEQAVAVSREAEWYRNSKNAQDANRRQEPTRAVNRHEAEKCTLSAQQAKNFVCSIPDAISADIDVVLCMSKGRIWPRFNGNYGERSMIFLNYADEQPQGEEHQFGTDTYTFVKRVGGPSSLIRRRDGYAMSSEVPDALMKYVSRWLEGNQRVESVCYDTSGGRISEFLEQVNSLGPVVDSMKFRVDDLGRWFGGRAVYFRRFGFRASTQGRQKSVGVYHVAGPGMDNLIDADYYKLFLEDFDSWLRLGGNRQAVRMTSVPMHITSMPSSMTGPPLPGVADVKKGFKDFVGQVMVISEER